MHLWPSLRIRESFKFDYLKKLEWNLKRMENESPTNKKKLLNTEEGGSNDVSAPIEQHGTLACCRDLLIILSCCYCCFCCGVLVHFTLFYKCLIEESLASSMLTKLSNLPTSLPATALLSMAVGPFFPHHL
eukprot:XP_019080190.1 PREDICTED: uncharacterized protein LOC100854745 isoform X1 [Vitis vinifera]